MGLFDCQSDKTGLDLIPIRLHSIGFFFQDPKVARPVTRCVQYRRDAVTAVRLRNVFYSFLFFFSFRVMILFFGFNGKRKGKVMEPVPSVRPVRSVVSFFIDPIGFHRAAYRIRRVMDGASTTATTTTRTTTTTTTSTALIIRHLCRLPTK